MDTLFCCFCFVFLFLGAGVYTTATKKNKLFLIAVYTSLHGVPIEGSRSLTKQIFQHYYHAYEATHSDLCMLPHNLYSLLTHWQRKHCMTDRQLDNSVTAGWKGREQKIWFHSRMQIAHIHPKQWLDFPKLHCTLRGRFYTLPEKLSFLENLRRQIKAI